MSKADEPAFPLLLQSPFNDRLSQGAIGLTKRDVFAAMAMHGILSNSDYQPTWEDHAKEAVQYAEALIVELDKERA